MLTKVVDSTYTQEDKDKNKTVVSCKVTLYSTNGTFWHMSEEDAREAIKTQAKVVKRTWWDKRLIEEHMKSLERTDGGIHAEIDGTEIAYSGRLFAKARPLIRKIVDSRGTK